MAQFQNVKSSGRKEHTLLLIGNFSHLLKRRRQDQHVVVVKCSHSWFALIAFHSGQMVLMVENKSTSVFFCPDNFVFCFCILGFRRP